MASRSKARFKIIDISVDRAQQLAKLYRIAEDEETLNRIIHWIDTDISSKLKLQDCGRCLTVTKK